jgi:hypothetical protein
LLVSAGVEGSWVVWLISPLDTLGDGLRYRMLTLNSGLVGMGTPFR